MPQELKCLGALGQFRCSQLFSSPPMDAAFPCKPSILFLKILWDAVFVKSLLEVATSAINPGLPRSTQIGLQASASRVIATSQNILLGNSLPLKSMLPYSMQIIELI